MNAVALKIKKLRSNIGLTQEQMADKVHLSVKAWQKIENGVTKLDLGRLNQIAGILEISLVDLINSEGSYVHQEIQQNENIYNKEVTINEGGLTNVERELFNKAISDKDKEIEFLRSMLQSKTS